MKIPRAPWPDDFPPVVLHTTVKVRDAHPANAAAKSGDAAAALALSRDLLADSQMSGLRNMLARATRPILIPVHAEERDGDNAVPLGLRVGLPIIMDVMCRLTLFKSTQ
jgi:hypothetical protein